MSRSTYIYYAQLKSKRDDPAFSAAFTVKHELLKWLGADADLYHVWRMKDGGGPTVVHLEIPHQGS